MLKMGKKISQFIAPMEALFELSRRNFSFGKRVRTAGLRVIEFLNVLLLKIYKIIVVILLHQN